MVRTKVNGQWQVTKHGEDYYRYNKNEYIVHALARKVVSYTKDGVTTHQWARGSWSGETCPVASMQTIRVNAHGAHIPAAFDEPLALPKITVQIRLAEEHEKQGY